MNFEPPDSRRANPLNPLKASNGEEALEHVPEPCRCSVPYLLSQWLYLANGGAAPSGRVVCPPMGSKPRSNSNRRQSRPLSGKAGRSPEPALWPASEPANTGRVSVVCVPSGAPWNYLSICRWLCFPPVSCSSCSSPKRGIHVVPASENGCPIPNQSGP